MFPSYMYSEGSITFLNSQQKMYKLSLLLWTGGFLFGFFYKHLSNF